MDFLSFWGAGNSVFGAFDMSGIAAIHYADGRTVSRSDIERVGRALRAYGGWGQSVGVMGPVAFAYAHFPDTPEASAGHQPLSGGDGRYALVFDGRLDNREELAAILRVDARRLTMLSDGHLAMLSWERWREQAMHRWVGDFACIIWDKVDARLFAVRDQFGARTLHYNANSNRIIIASAPKCVHALGDLPRELDEQKIADALCQLYHDGERTFFKGVCRIPPGSFIEVSGSSLGITRYYDIRDHIQPVRYKNDDEYVEQASELFDDSVRATLRSNRPIGAFLSGGLDSSSMSVVAARALSSRGQRLVTFTSVPEDAWDERSMKGRFGDEAPFVRDIAAMHPTLECNFVDGSGVGHYYKQEELLLALEMPVRNALNLQWTHAILEQAKNRGIGVMLQGSFGNATLSRVGDGLYGELLSQGAFVRLYQELKVLSRDRRHFLHNVLKHLVFPIGPTWLWDAKEALRGRSRLDQDWYRFIAADPRFAEEKNILGRMVIAGYTYAGGKPEYERKSWLNMLGNWMTETGDVMQGFRAMYGVDIRDPFANRNLVEWSFGLPESQLRKNGVGRLLIRRMMKGQLPKSVLDNRKIGQQTADWHVRLTRDLPAIRSQLEAIEHDQYLSRMINVELLKNLVNDWPEKTINDPSDDRVFQIPILLPMALQIARFVEREKGLNRP